MKSPILAQWNFLKSSIRSGKQAHAYLLYGNNVALQEELAGQFLELLHCQYISDVGDPCSKCQICLQVQNSSLPDIRIIAPQSNRDIPIEAIRTLQSYLSLTPHSSMFKTVLIKQAHTMNATTQSAFLKTLEEPRGSTIFLLTSSYPSLLLPTIISRLQRIPVFLFRSTQANEPHPNDLESLSKKSLQSRFLIAEKVSMDTEKLIDQSKEWLAEARQTLLSTLSSRDITLTRRSLRTVLALQEMIFYIQRTNANTRLALEQVMLTL